MEYNMQTYAGNKIPTTKAKVNRPFTFGSNNRVTSKQSVFNQSADSQNGLPSVFNSDVQTNNVSSSTPFTDSYFNNKNTLPGTAPKANTGFEWGSAIGNVSKGLEIGSGLMNAYLGYQQLGLAKDTFKHNVMDSNRTYAMAKEGYDRQKARAIGISNQMVGGLGNPTTTV